MAPHCKICEFLQQIDQYRGIVEDLLFDRLGRPSFFFEAVEMVMGRIAVRMEQQGIAKNKSTTCAFAAQESWIREAVSCEARKSKREIEERFVQTGILKLPRDCRGES